MSGHEYLVELLGAVALLLWATRMVRTGILRAFGSDLKGLVTRATATPTKACLTGIGIAASLQSATATALLAISFAERGILALGPGLALILGADIGSTLVVQLLSFDISAVMPFLLIAGLGAFSMGSNVMVRQLGRAGLGLGLIIISLGMIAATSEQLRESEALRVVLAALSDDLILAVVVAALLTWLAHSSVAAVLLFVSLAISGVVPVVLGMALVLGANVGGALVCVGLTFRNTAAARRIPIGNLAFRVLGTIALLSLLRMLQPWFAEMDPDPGRQLANFHTGFNLTLAVLFVPFCGWVAALLNQVIKEKVDEGQNDEFGSRHLDPTLIALPALALSQATREVMRMADIVEAMLSRLMTAFEAKNTGLVKEISQSEDQVDRLYEDIKLYLTEISRGVMSKTESQTCMNLISFTTNLEHIGDIIDNNLLELASKKNKNKLDFSPEGWRELRDIHALLLEQMQLAMTVFVNGETDLARDLVAAKDGFRDRQQTAIYNHLRRLRDGRVKSIETSALHLDILREFKGIASHLTSVAYPILESTGELRPTRLRKAE